MLRIVVAQNYPVSKCHSVTAAALRVYPPGQTAAKVVPFVSERKIAYPVLLDPGRKVNELFQVDGIPKSFVYDRSGKLVAQSIDMRTQRQFLEMLAQAGLQ